MINEFLLPKLGQSVESCIIVEWKKKKGDRVKEGDVLCEVETDKATLEVESTLTGTILKILHPEGDDVPVLTPIALIGDENSLEAPEKPEVNKTVKTVESITPASMPPVSKVKISPRAKKLAEENRISSLDYERVKGSGPGGRILEHDIEDYLKSASYKKAQGAPLHERVSLKTPSIEQPAEGEKSTPLSGIRKVIAEKMLESLKGSAQYTITASADAERILQYRERLKKLDPESPLVSVTINDIVLFTTSRVLTNFRNINSLIINDKIIEKNSVNLGFAVDTPKGLLVPVIKNADKLSLLKISSEAKRLKDACIKSTIQPDEFLGGTFTVTNLGYYDIESFTPIINPPQTGILGVCSIQPKPVFNKSEGLAGSYSEQVRFIPALKLSLTLDHRVIDGASGARFLQALCRAFEEFDLLLAG